MQCLLGVEQPKNSETAPQGCRENSSTAGQPAGSSSGAGVGGPAHHRMLWVSQISQAQKPGQAICCVGKEPVKSQQGAVSLRKAGRPVRCLVGKNHSKSCQKKLPASLPVYCLHRKGSGCLCAREVARMAQAWQVPLEPISLGVKGAAEACTSG